MNDTVRCPACGREARLTRLPDENSPARFRCTNGHCRNGGQFDFRGDDPQLDPAAVERVVRASNAEARLNAFKRRTST